MVIVQNWGEHRHSVPPPWAVIIERAVILLKAIWIVNFFRLWHHMYVKFIYLCIHSLSQQVFMEFLLSVRHCARLWDIVASKADMVPALVEFIVSKDRY